MLAEVGEEFGGEAVGEFGELRKFGGAFVVRVFHYLQDGGAKFGYVEGGVEGGIALRGDGSRQGDGVGEGVKEICAASARCGGKVVGTGDYVFSTM